MTREEAIDLVVCGEWIYSLQVGNKEMEKLTEAISIIDSALRPVSREQVEKAWRGEWIGMTDDDGCTWQECSRCEHDLDSMEEAQNFCPACGAPMTDEAVEMVMERWEALNDGKGD
jgi:hypothetical protein